MSQEVIYRNVHGVRKGENGEITDVCFNAGAAIGKVINAEEVIGQLNLPENHVLLYEYRVDIPGQPDAKLHAVTLDDGRQYLRTNPDKSEPNNLAELPTCEHLTSLK